MILVAIIAPLIAPYDYQSQDYTAMNQAPSGAHVFGTDAYGRNIFSRVINGARYSLLIADEPTTALDVTIGFNDQMV